ncbi:EGF-like repeat and discoidin I-like domain-containing protein 3 [Exaiptasia diaphana]|uniref:EGF-like repeat and discoidin I-like domain-containing protein 3 n=1 Tax=Exaiptasia diaphana TaxID=2652724 RepID=A0A913YTJ8_EXADI|nr:EGF-like repeat and discoidin I-like domain-containing protein 3 [Exaiptasia diaphana]
MCNVILLVFLVLLTNFQLVFSTDSSDEDHRSSLIITTDDHMLIDQSMHERKASSSLDCAFCLVADKCKSFNYNKGTGACHLNRKRAKNRNELVQAHGFIYGEKVYQNPCVVKPCQNGGECIIHEDGEDYKCKCMPGIAGKNCQNVQQYKRPLGMESKAIPDSRITASSYYSKDYLPSQARLNMNSYGWAPTAKGRIGSWLKVDLSTVHTVTAIATQGSKLHSSEWINSYSLQYSLDGTTFKNYQAGKVFKGNTDQNTVVKHDLNPPIRARFVKVLPKTWNAWPSMRMELYGCK